MWLELENKVYVKTHPKKIVSERGDIVKKKIGFWIHKIGKKKKKSYTPSVKRKWSSQNLYNSIFSSQQKCLRNNPGITSFY